MALLDEQAASICLLPAILFSALANFDGRVIRRQAPAASQELPASRPSPVQARGYECWRVQPVPSRLSSAPSELRLVHPSPPSERGTQVSHQPGPLLVQASDVVLLGDQALAQLAHFRLQLLDLLLMRSMFWFSSDDTTLLEIELFITALQAFRISIIDAKNRKWRTLEAYSITLKVGETTFATGRRRATFAYRVTRSLGTALAKKIQLKLLSWRSYLNMKTRALEKFY